MFSGMLPHMLKPILLALFAVVMAAAADISGTWNFSVETDQGSGNPTFTLKQDGEKLTGTYSGQFGQASVAGTVKGDKVEIGFAADAGGQKMDVKYSGTVESPTRMTGVVDLGGMGTGKWTARKQ
jgi:hypothetical protein